MTKQELIDLLDSLEISVSEGEASIAKMKVFPKIVFWESYWEDQPASGAVYQEIDTYQISFFAKVPRHEKLLELRDKLRKCGIMTSFSHEYAADKNLFHSFTAIEVTVANGG